MRVFVCKIKQKANTAVANIRATFMFLASLFNCLNVMPMRQKKKKKANHCDNLWF